MSMNLKIRFSASVREQRAQSWHPRHPDIQSNETGECAAELSLSAYLSRYCSKFPGSAAVPAPKRWLRDR